MKHLQLFENFEDDAKAKANDALEGLVNSVFLDHTYANTGRGVAGNYEFATDTHTEGSQEGVANIYFDDDVSAKIG